ncbi:type IV conjugative transfer system protein TraV [Vibrio europaeus]|uniref:type IV conjugative transfer system protein TraV n=1 Tax=Vibrio europaeus TaxID=300876 RepID=UPI00233E9016|nr:type IV conjugative transfer system protein TraV [Vibrio europaeus]MDC5870558.1 type IV conjugative transfer system protein TraV [Vibrio europaeus]
MLRILLTFVSVTLLSGCAAGLGEEFSCNNVGGVKSCTRMNDIRDNIDAYRVPNDAVHSPSSRVKALPSVFATLPRGERHGQPRRTPDNVKKITIFPFKTATHKHYIDTLDIYFVVDESTWTGKPVQAIRKD